MKSVDVIIIGSGAAGLVAAQEVASSGCEVVLLSKGQTGRSGATATITGDISVDGRTMSNVLGLKGDTGDSEELFYAETLKAGAYLNDRLLAEDLVRHVGGEVKRLMDDGLKVIGIGHAPGHTRPRGVLISGMQVLQILARKAVASGVKFRDEFYVTEIMKISDGAGGIAGIDLRTGRVEFLAAKAVVIATGGGMMVHPVTTAPEELVGDGYRMALAAGAELVNMEMVQFLPCCLLNPPLWRGIQFPWIIGPQSGTRAWLLNRYGERFMARYDPERMETSTRDIISIACVREVQEGRGSPGGGVFMSWAHLPHDILDFLPQWYGKPLLRESWQWEGFDFAPLVARIKQGFAVEVAPASHFYMGGIRTDRSGSSAVPGLFVCGEAAGGVHGANRLSGNACSQFLVQGRAVGSAAARFAKRNSLLQIPEVARRDVQAQIEAPLSRPNGLAPHEVYARVQAIANDGLNVLRTGPALTRALEEIRDIRRNDIPSLGSRSNERRYNRNWIDVHEVTSAALTVETIALSALIRTESRGAHYRDDFPALDDTQCRHSVISQGSSELNIRSEPVPA
jgi:succinate dehydrogenase/fumarate reductase flavoprotein subunit